MSKHYLNLVLIVHPLCKDTRATVLWVYTECARRTPDTHLAANAGTLILQHITLMLSHKS